MNLNSIPITLLLLVTLGMTVAADKPPQEITPLDLKGKNVERLETSASQIGLTRTQVFYTFSDHRVVVAIRIDNTDSNFPVTGSVCQFARDISPEQLAKWLNNQHSDAQFSDAPEPTAMIELPMNRCKTLRRKRLGQKAVNKTTYDEYSVEIMLAETKVNEQFQLQQFTDTVKVYVPAK
ncbi:MAG: hypothetical protein ACK58L_16000 [Planctomycetota bacterium]